MPKIFRRSWERYQIGRAGAISNPLPARSGADGVVSGASQTTPAGIGTPVQVFTSATASFVAGDVGRTIRLTNTAGGGRYDGNYIIDSVNSGTSVNLRANHNVGGTPASPARFFENATLINWRIHESCTFAADAAGDIQDFYPGSYLGIEGAVNSVNSGLWQISHRVDSQNVILTKSTFYYPAEASTTPVTVFTNDAMDTFVVESSLRWFITDKTPHNTAELHMLLLQAFIDSGWTLWQQRGHSNSLNVLADVILKSTGEPDPLAPGGKAMYLRMVLHYGGHAVPGIYTQGLFISWAVYQHWDPTLTASSPGNGVGHLKAGGASVTTSANTVSSASGDWQPDSAIDIVSLGRAGLPHDTSRRVWTFFGDRDEIYAGTRYSTNSFHLQVSHLKPISSNPNIVTVTAPVVAGANVLVNVGTVDITTLTPPYALGDNITIVGRRSSTPEYIETTTITGFDNTDTANRKVKLANVSMAYGNGPETLKAQLGEDPFPVATEASASSNYNPRLHNLSKLANPTGKDYDATNFGSAATAVTVIASFSEINPNRKTGKLGLVAMHLKSTGTGEYRGRWRYFWNADVNNQFVGMKVTTSDGNAYVQVDQSSSSWAAYVGPMSKAMAGIR